MTARHSPDPTAVATLAKAASHPTRVEMLIAMEAAAVSPTQFATEFDLPLGSVSYHVSVLLKVGCVEIVKRIPRQGSIEHFYRSTARGKKLLAGLAGI